MPQRHKLVIAASVFALATCLTGGAARAQELRGDRAIMFTFSQPVVLPQVTLPAGKYLFRLADSLTTRTIVQVYSDDQSRLMGTMMTLPALRAEATDTPQVQFMEAAAGAPMPIRSYWFPGSRSGWEFIYPRQQAMTIAKNAKEPVLSTAQDVSGDSMSSAALARIDSSGQQSAANSSSNSSNESAQVSNVDADNAPAAFPQPSSVSTPAPVTRSTAIAQNDSADQAPVRTRLPKTATSTPAVALVGLMALAVGLGLGLARRRFV